MPRRYSFLAAGLLAVVCANAHGQQASSAASAATNSIVDVQGGQIRVVTVATGLVHPWSIALLPGEASMLVAERNGQVRLIENGALAAEPVWSAEGVAAGNELKWLALHPGFASNRLVYLSYPKAGERGTTLADASWAMSARSSSRTLGKPAATWAARSCSARTGRCTSPSATAIGSAARAPRTTACA